jgi:crossover junction endodeoxyribonuclease RuvC
MNTYIGVDPGKSGAVVAITSEGIKICRNDMTEADLGSFFKTFEESWEPVFAMIERVHSMPKQGVSSTFKFGENYGFLRGCLISAGIPFEEVTSQKWQKFMGCLSKGDKNVTKARAQQLFPGIKVIHQIADALLIAEYCRRVHV